MVKQSQVFVPISIPMEMVLFHPSLKFSPVVCKMGVALGLTHPERSHAVVELQCSKGDPLDCSIVSCSVSVEYGLQLTAPDFIVHNPTVLFEGSNLLSLEPLLIWG